MKLGQHHFFPASRPLPLTGTLTSVERLNSEGIARDQLAYVLTQRSLVQAARRINSCLLCRRIGVNEAGLCDVCYALLDDPQEQALVSGWISGTGP